METPFKPQNSLPEISPAILSREELADIFSSMKPLHSIEHKQRVVYMFHGNEQSDLLKEFGRIREINYRAVGASSQKSIDIDAYDLDENKCYRQLVLWDKQEREIVAGARIFSSPWLKKNLDRTVHKDDLSLACFLNFSQSFQEECLQSLIEITRVFVSKTPTKQSSGQATEKLKADFYKLDQLYAAIGKIIAQEKIFYITGRVVLHTRSLPFPLRQAIQAFFHISFASYTVGHVHSRSVYPKWLREQSLSNRDYQNSNQLAQEYGFSKKNSYEENIAILSKISTEQKTHIPALIRNYLLFSRKLHYFGIFEDNVLSNIEEIGLMSACQDLQVNRQKRYFSPEFVKELAQRKASLDKA